MIEAPRAAPPEQRRRASRRAATGRARSAGGGLRRVARERAGRPGELGGAEAGSCCGALLSLGAEARDRREAGDCTLGGRLGGVRARAGRRSEGGSARFFGRPTRGSRPTRPASSSPATRSAGGASSETTRLPSRLRPSFAASAHAWLCSHAAGVRRPGSSPPPREAEAAPERGSDPRLCGCAAVRLPPRGDAGGPRRAFAEPRPLARPRPSQSRGPRPRRGRGGWSPRAGLRRSLVARRGAEGVADSGGRSTRFGLQRPRRSRLLRNANHGHLAVHFPSSGTCWRHLACLIA